MLYMHFTSGVEHSESHDQFSSIYVFWARHPLPIGESTQQETSHDHRFIVENFTSFGYVPPAWLRLVGSYVTRVLRLAQDSKHPMWFPQLHPCPPHHACWPTTGHTWFKCRGSGHKKKRFSSTSTISQYLSLTPLTAWQPALSTTICCQPTLCCHSRDWEPSVVIRLQPLHQGPGGLGGEQQYAIFKPFREMWRRVSPTQC